jgi:hypothetical protein
MPRYGRAFVTGVLLGGVGRQNIVALARRVALGECAGWPGRGTVHFPLGKLGWLCSAMRLCTWGALLVTRDQEGPTRQGSGQASRLRRGARRWVWQLPT